MKASLTYFICVLVCCLLNGLYADSVINKYTDMFVSLSDKLNLALPDQFALKGGKYEYQTDIENLVFRGLSSQQKIDLKATYAFDIPFNLSDVVSFQIIDDWMFFTVNNTLYFMDKMETDYNKIDNCSMVYISSDFIFCSEITTIPNSTQSKIKLNCYQIQENPSLFGTTEIMIDEKIVFTDMFNYFKNEDDGIILIFITQHENKFNLHYFVYERTIQKLYLKLEFPENNLIMSNYINNQIIFVSENYITYYVLTSQEKVVTDTVKYAYSFYLYSIDSCDYDNSDATYMNITCTLNIPQKILKFNFLKSNFAINTQNDYMMDLTDTTYKRTAIKYKYIFLIFEDRVEAYSNYNLEFHSVVPGIQGEDLSTKPMTSNSLQNSIHFIISNNLIYNLYFYSNLSAQVHTFTKGTYFYIEYYLPNSSNVYYHHRFSIFEIPNLLDFYIIYEKDTLENIDLYGNALIWESPKSVVLGPDIHTFIKIDDDKQIIYPLKVDKNYNFRFNTEFNASLSEITEFVYYVRFLY